MPICFLHRLRRGGSSIVRSRIFCSHRSARLTNPSHSKPACALSWVYSRMRGTLDCAQHGHFGVLAVSMCAPVGRSCQVCHRRSVGLFHTFLSLSSRCETRRLLVPYLPLLKGFDPSSLEGRSCAPYPLAPSYCFWHCVLWSLEVDCTDAALQLHDRTMLHPRSLLRRYALQEVPPLVS